MTPQASLAPRWTDPERERIVAFVLDALDSPHSRRVYGQALRDFLEWQAGRPFTRATVQEWKTHLRRRGLAGSTINVRLAAVRKLAHEGAEHGYLPHEDAARITSIRGVKALGVRLGNWATAEQAKALLDAPDLSKVKGLRDRAILATLIGCALRRDELSRVEVDDIQQRDGRAVFADLRGKGRRVRTVPIPEWVECALADWFAAGGIRKGRVFRSIHRNGTIGKRLSTTGVLEIVSVYSCRIGAKLTPHDLRRTCAKLCRASGAELEQIQFLLGHQSVETTERYLGGKQELRHAANDRLGLVREAELADPELDRS